MRCLIVFITIATRVGANDYVIGHPYCSPMHNSLAKPYHTVTGMATLLGTIRWLLIVKECAMDRTAAGWLNGFIGVLIFSGSLPATRMAVMEVRSTSFLPLPARRSPG